MIDAETLSLKKVGSGLYSKLPLAVFYFDVNKKAAAANALSSVQWRN